MQQRIAVASGKGGVGKTLFSANLAIALAQAGRSVIAVDLDLGGSNLHTILGIRNRNPGIGEFINGSVAAVEQLISPTSVDRLYIIPGDALLVGTANLPYYRKKALLEQLDQLPADFLVFDLGSGTAYNTIDFFLHADRGIVVTTPDTTAILNAYAFVKGALSRALVRAYPNRSAERAFVTAFLTERLERTPRTMRDLLPGLEEQFGSETAEVARAILDEVAVHAIVNMGRDQRDVLVAARLKKVALQNLGRHVHALAYLPYDDGAARAAVDRVPPLLANPDGAYARAVRRCADALMSAPPLRAADLHPGDEDIRAVAQQFTSEP